MEGTVHTNKWRQELENACVRIEAYQTVVDYTRPDIRPRPGQGTGSGFFVPSNVESYKGRECSGKWYSILTCAHVVSGCQQSEVNVIFPKVGKTKFPARIQSVNPDSDLAIIAICITDKSIQEMIQPLRLNETMPVGCPVSAFGYPLGQWGLTSSSGEYGAFQNGQYQHNADISPGNSGGPLIRRDTGEVVGVNASTIAGGAASGVHFAVPISLYRRLQSEMLAGSETPIMPPRMGFCYHSASDFMLEEFGIDRLEAGGRTVGTYVHYVFKNSAAEKAGLVAGSLLLSVSWEVTPKGNWSEEHVLDQHGEALASFSGTQRVGVQYILERIPVGSKVRIKFISKDEDGKYTQKIKETVQQPFNNGSYRLYSSPLEAIPDFSFFAGLCVMQLCENHRPYFPLLFQKLSPEQREMNNLIITAVVPNYTEAIPFRPGTVIQYVNGAGNKKHFEEGAERMDTLEKYRAAICKNNGYVTIVDVNNRRYTLKLSYILEHERMATENNIYTTDKHLMDCLTKK
jgi:S1-C subfamily serine protease